jgi:NAD(P)H dehydrogenase (quinone)
LIAVTGVTGGLGGHVARLLAKRGVAQRLVVRDPARVADLPLAEVAAPANYGNEGEMRAALAGCGALYLVSATENPDRVALHTAAVDAAVAAGVERIVYTSFLAAAPDATFTFARDHWATEEHIRRSGVRFTFLRHSQYLEMVPRLVGEDGVIRGPAGDGRCAWVARDDCAAAAAAVLTGAGHDGQTYDLTGPAAHTLGWAAEQLSLSTGRRIGYVPETIEEAYESRATTGAPRYELDGWVTSYAAIATGEMDVVSEAVPRLTGRQALTLPGFLRKQRQ